MPFVFVITGIAGVVYVLRRRGVLAVPHARVRAFASAAPRWLLVYMVALAAQLAHALFLTVGSLVIYADPSVTGLHSFIPLWALLIYVASNLALLAYGVLLFRLMFSRRRAAIFNNVLFNALSVTFLVTWFLLGAKSPIGTVIDSLPGIAAIAYFSLSRRLRDTFSVRAEGLARTAG
jgi:hypothetical protein